MNKEWKLWKAMVNGEESMNDLKIYSIIYAIHEDKQWRAYRAKVVAKNTVDALNIITKKYGEVKLNKFDEIELEEGMFL